MEASFRSYKMSQFCDLPAKTIRSFLENEIFPLKHIDLISFENRPQKTIDLTPEDPTCYKDFKPDPKDLELLSRSVGKYDGYIDFRGLPEARSFLAGFYSSKGMTKIQDDEVFITFGCQFALWLAFSSLADRGDNILIPELAIPNYRDLALQQGIIMKTYALKPDNNWEIDLKDLECKIDDKTRAILVQNPCNPTGSILSREHMLDILAMAEKYRIPIISDENFEYIVFPGQKFVSFTEIATRTPIFLCSGLGKKNLAPGWMTGWLVLQGPEGVFEDIKKGINNLLSILMNSNTICMQNIPEFTSKDPSYLQGKMFLVQERMELFKKTLADFDFVKFVEPKGTFYGILLLALDKFQGINDSWEFCIQFFKRKNVLCLPAECFGGKSFIRVMLCADEDVIIEFSKRLKEFYNESQKI